MKCEKCNEREANFFYTASINGETAQRRLCLGCARELGLTTAFERPLLGDFGFFGREPFAMLDSFFSNRPMLDSFFGSGPARAALTERRSRTEAETEPGAEKIPAGAGDGLKARRELIALKHQLKAAVRDENFERAAELRDKIKELEANAYEK